MNFGNPSLINKENDAKNGSYGIPQQEYRRSNNGGYNQKQRLSMPPFAG